MRRSRASAERLEAALAEAELLDMEGLRTRWQALAGTPAPASFRVPLLRAAVAYKLQERALGGLKPGTRSLLRRVAEQADRHRMPAVSSNADPAAANADEGAVVVEQADPVPPAQSEAWARATHRSRRPATRIKPGTRLLRTWQGSTHEVLVGQGEVTYQGCRYRSLSEVARIITGQRWSGPLFFGLKGPAAPAAANVSTRRRPREGQGT